MESELGTGSVFRVRLPAASADSSVQAVPDSVEPASGRRGKILVVDDDAILAGTLRACSQSILRSGAVTT